MKIDLTKIATDAARSALRGDVNQTIASQEAIRKGVHFVPPERREPSKPVGYHYVFCTHNVPYWMKCTKCGRTKELAAKNADLVCKAIGGAAFFTK